MKARKPLITFRVPMPRWFAKSGYRAFLWGCAWITEAQLENYFAGLWLPRWAWEILGPINIGLYASLLFGHVYACLSIAVALTKFKRWLDIKRGIPQ